MSAHFLLERRGLTLVPYDAVALEDMHGLPFGKALNCKVTLSRSLPQHRRYWAMMSQVVQATGCAPTRDHLHQAVKVALGYTMPVFDSRGETVAHIPDSTSFSAMGQVRFNQFSREVEALLASRWGFVMEDEG